MNAIQWAACAKCAKRVCKDAAFCGRCGARVERAAPSVRAAHAACPDCAVEGTVVEDEHDGAFVCSRCGLRLGAVISESPEWRNFEDAAENPCRVGFPIEMGMPEDIQLATYGRHRSLDAHRRACYLDAHKRIDAVCKGLAQPGLVLHARELFGIYRECTQKISSLDAACAAAVYTASFVRGTAYAIPLRALMAHTARGVKRSRVARISAAMVNLASGAADNAKARTVLVSQAPTSAAGDRLCYAHLAAKTRAERVADFLDAMCRKFRTTAGLPKMLTIYEIYALKFPDSTTQVELVAGGIYYLVLRDMVEHAGEYGCLPPRSVRQVDVERFVHASTSAISEMLRVLPNLRMRRDRKRAAEAETRCDVKRRSVSDDV